MKRVTDFNNRWLIVLILSAYILIHLFTLSRFPFMHSDEAWLAGLTRTMLAEKSFAATESFFSLLPRFPHTLRTLYHLIQMPFIAIGYTLFLTRLPSLIAGLAVLAVLYRLGRKLFPPIAIFPVLFLAADVQFWYASHFGRQEIFVLLFLLLALDSLVPAPEKEGRCAPVRAGILLGIAAGFHPNAFIAAFGAGGFCFGRALASEDSSGRRAELKALFILILTTAVGALFWLAASLLINPGFAADYAGLGAGQGVGNSFLVKMLGLPGFFERLYLGVSGTYFMPDIRLQLLLSSAALGFSLLLFTGSPAKILPLVGLAAGVTGGILIIGKYSPPSVLFVLVPGYLLAGNIWDGINRALSRPYLRRIITVLILFPVLCFAWVTASSIIQSFRSDYPQFLTNLTRSVPSGDGRILGNLNMAYAFEEGRLRDYREMGMLHEKNSSIEEYLGREDIRIVILTDELELINRDRPLWNRMYGNPYYWYDQLTELVNLRGTLIAQFAAPWYGVRLQHLMGKRDYAVKIYSVSPEGP